MLETTEGYLLRREIDRLGMRVRRLELIAVHLIHRVPHDAPEYHALEHLLHELQGDPPESGSDTP